MAATFGTLDLAELGTVGNPNVQYAKFETEVSQPKGYDGGVLANFRRGATTIKFDLALTGTKSEITNKLNLLAAELTKGQQELVLPNMTPGYHFDASANCALQPNQLIDGFVLPLEFVVPHGLAISETKSAPFESSPTYGGGLEIVVEFGGIMPVRWVVRYEGAVNLPKEYVPQLKARVHVYDTIDSYMKIGGKYVYDRAWESYVYEQVESSSGMVINSTTGSAYAGDYEMGVYPITMDVEKLFAPVQPGVEFQLDIEPKTGSLNYENARLEWHEESVW